MTFEMYSKYYDLLYSDKDYVKEVEYLNRLIRPFINQESPKLLDLGCGTGKHAFEFEKLGYEVTGVELSKTMCEIAQSKNRERRIRFINKNVHHLNLNERFDVVTSLFHVLSYQLSNEDLSRFIETVMLHKQDEGVFIFDFWYGPGVLTEKPEQRTKLKSGNGLKIERRATPELHVNENIVDVNYEISIEENEVSFSFKELHRMRYYFLPELENALNKFGLKILIVEESFTGNIPNASSWNVTIVAT